MPINARRSTYLDGLLEENKAPSQNFIIAMPQRQKRLRLTA
ncbi:hypothetical protein SAMN05443247_05124 [Bradyrhizobium erythrophlei]|jgi:hypothetical protein|nr:hypothetical protein SAMN05443247_05124 [Bradyrhizobium erythrophlei]